MKTLEQRRLAYRTLDYIRAHPQEHQQRQWRCESGMCFAGWAVQLAGGRWVTGPADESRNLLYAEPADDQWVVDGTITARVRAERLLGLDYDESDRLFHADNTVDELTTWVYWYFGDRPDGAS